MDLKNIHNAFFIGIGGIGMSALARYLKAGGIYVSGYDRTPTELTAELEKDGIPVHYEDAISAISPGVLADKSGSVVIFTPAVPSSQSQLNYLRNNGYTLLKRSEMLGLITSNRYTAAVAGTHGKTTTSTLLAHILISSGYDCTAFLGGISRNTGSNFFSRNSSTPDSGNNKIQAPVVVEADEYDRSFLTLNPDIAIITSVDADHLDIYGTPDALKDAFTAFTSKIKPGGYLVIKSGITLPVQAEKQVKIYTYGIKGAADFYASDVMVTAGRYQFTLNSPFRSISGLELGMPGLHNVENAVAACAVALIMGVEPAALHKAIKEFRGVQRRFDFRFTHPDLIYIDDYAHHPDEINTCIQSVRELFPGKTITGIFQPHLFSRTRDFMYEFARSLSALDEVILLDIYPARELPISGISSAVLLEKIQTKVKSLCSFEEALGRIREINKGVILTIGAGDIDQLVKPIEAIVKQNAGVS